MIIHKITDKKLVLDCTEDCQVENSMSPYALLIGNEWKCLFQGALKLGVLSSEVVNLFDNGVMLSFNDKKKVITAVVNLESGIVAHIKFRYDGSR